jgi:ferredoxin-NADP reductase
MVGTGTGVAPFASMIKELDHQALEGKRDDVRYTLLHANRTLEELAYHEQFLAIEAAGRFDFSYLPAISRPRDGQAQDLGAGRANNILRLLFEMPLREEEDLRLATAEDEVAARRALERAVRPRLPEHLRRDRLVERMTSGETVVLSCGNPASMRDVKIIAESNGMRFEKEDWKHDPAG